MCIHEGNFKASSRSWKRMVYATTITSDLSNFEDRFQGFLVKSGVNDDISFRIYRENDTYTRCITSENLAEIYLGIRDSKVLIYGSTLPTDLSSFTAE